MTPFPTERERRFAAAAVRRKSLFLVLSVVGVVVAVLLVGFYVYRRIQDAGYPLGVRSVVVVLILLNARQNLRQYRYAALLERLGDKSP